MSSEYLKKIINSQKNIVVITDLVAIQDANKSFFDFFVEYKSLDDFKNKYSCISNLFVEVDRFGFIYENMQDKDWNTLQETWYEYVLNHRRKNNRVLIIREDKEYIFNISISILEDNMYIVDLTDITDIENYKYQLENIVTKKNDELKELNATLENSIKDKIQELHSLNKELKSTIQDEREKNTIMDKLLFKQSRHAVMGEMIGMIAHQWKQPLSSMNIALNSIEIAKQFGTLSDDMLQSNINKMKKTIEFLAQTMDQFRNFFKEDKNKKSVKIVNIIEEALSYIEHQLTVKNISVNVESSYDKDIAVYPNELVQVFMNIVNNSKDAFLSNKIENASINITCDEQDGYLVIKIEDNAGGIPQSILDNIFNPYFSTKGSDGTGLGLYMSKIIIEEHSKGMIQACNNSTNNGAIFTIKLPI